MTQDPGVRARVLLIDNYDSFTYNLHHQITRVLGMAPLVVRNDQLTLADIRRLDPDAIVISPGPGRPDVVGDVGVGAAILAELITTPILGVCLGLQALVHSAGGVVDRVEPVHGRAAEIAHTGTDLFAGLPPRLRVIRYHSLAAHAPLPPALEPIAWTSDGLTMAVRHRTRPAWGVQFHPESICTEHGDEVIANFLAVAAEWRTPTPPTPAWSSMNPPPAHRSRRRSAGARRHVRRLPGWHEPEDVFVALYGNAGHAFWLDSSLTAPELTRFSFLGAGRPGGTALSFDLREGCVTVRRGETVERLSDNVLDALDTELSAVALPPLEQLPFAGGFVGYFGYEIGAECEDRPGDPRRKRDKPHGPLPDAYWLLADRVLAFDHHQRRAWAIALSVGESTAEQEAWLEQIADEWSGVTPAAQPAPPVATDSPARPAADQPLVIRLDRDPETYLSDIVACQDAIRAGDSYELCLTTQAELDPVGSPLDLYRVLRRVSPAPYAAYLRIGDCAVLSSSLERFLAVDVERTVTARPMKGTAPRHVDPVIDARLREALRTSEKDRSENLMIVDLLRNDLGRVSMADTVRVPRLMEVESYAGVHQLTSTITGRLKPDAGVIDAVRAAFPGGSMTGAPKLRSMEILDRLEPRPRGVYSGSLGYLAADGQAELSIVIRTAVCTPTATTVGIGGAVVALSDPQAEFEEILLKAQGVVRAILAWQRRPYDPATVLVVGPGGASERMER